MEKGVFFLSEAWQTRQTLLERVQDLDNESAWDEFVSYYREFIQFVMIKLGYTGHDKDDLTQEILISIWKSFREDRYQKEKAMFRTWLSRVIKYKLIDLYRKNASQKKLKQNFFEVKSNELEIKDSEFDQMINHEWEVHLIKLAMQNLSKTFSEQAIKTFELALEGLNDSEIAERMDMKVNSINKLKNRVQKRLALEIESLKKELET